MMVREISVASTAQTVQQVGHRIRTGRRHSEMSVRYQVGTDVTVAANVAPDHTRGVMRLEKHVRTIIVLRTTDLTTV